MSEAFAELVVNHNSALNTLRLGWTIEFEAVIDATHIFYQDINLSSGLVGIKEHFIANVFSVLGHEMLALDKDLNPVMSIDDFKSFRMAVVCDPRPIESITIVLAQGFHG